MEREWPPKSYQDIRQGSQGGFHREDCTKVIHGAEIPRHCSHTRTVLRYNFIPLSYDSADVVVGQPQLHEVIQGPRSALSYCFAPLSCWVSSSTIWLMLGCCHMNVPACRKGKERMENRPRRGSLILVATTCSLVTSSYKGCWEIQSIAR